ncbi:hypothetical protein GCM10010182_30680 [Actinomadura cremea]|nr:hypothetical protein GCM10010182_30680 [Actinomadura cremea]
MTRTRDPQDDPLLEQFLALDAPYRRADWAGFGETLALPEPFSIDLDTTDFCWSRTPDGAGRPGR